MENARRRLFRQITEKVADDDGTVRAVTLDRGTEDLLRQSLGQSDGEPVLAPDLDVARRFIGVLESFAAQRAESGGSLIVISPPDLRKPLFEFATRFVSDLMVLTARELVPGTVVEPVGTVEMASITMGRAA